MVEFDRGRALTVVTLSLVVLTGTLWLSSPTGPLAGVLHPLEYDTATVTISDSDGAELASVDVRIADSQRERYVGLSQTESLADGEGMLFVHDDSGEHRYVMRDMAFSLDILFVADNGTITTIHHAAVPEQTSGDDLRRYPGTGAYVLEVPRGYANATGVSVGDEMTVPEGVRG